MNQTRLPENQSSVVLLPSKWKWLLLSLACLIFIGLFLRGQLMVWLMVPFLGLGLVATLIQLLPGAAYLRLSREGFEFCSLFRKSGVIPWDGVSEFRVALIPFGNEMVVFDADARPKPAIQRINRSLVGAGEALPDTHGMKPQELASILNAGREKYG